MWGSYLLLIHITIQNFIKHLPPSLILEPEFSGHSFYFLECLITFTPPTFLIIYLSKNYAFYKQHKRLKFYSFQNYYSYHSDRELVASNNLRSKFSAISKYCNSDVAIYISILSWFQDFIMAEYPAKLVIKILKEFYFKSSKPVWKMLVSEVSLDYNFREDIFSFSTLKSKFEFFWKTDAMHSRINKNSVHRVKFQIQIYKSPGIDSIGSNNYVAYKCIWTRYFIFDFSPRCRKTLVFFECVFSK